VSTGGVPDTDDLRSDLAHLWRRAGFGATPADLDRSVAQGWDATLAELCDTSKTDPAADAVPAPAFDTASITAGLQGKGDKAKKKPARIEARQEGTALTLWWLRRMVASERPLREKLTWTWHGHFATSIQKVRVPELMYVQNQTQRRLASGRFEDLAQAMVVDPAMLVWLDGAKSTKDAPNENLGREMQELFLLGHGHQGHQPYTEADVKAAARSLTGWRVDRASATARLVPARHDDSVKEYLGSKGNFGVTDIVRLALADKASAPFVTSRLVSRLGRPVAVDDRLVDALAPGFAADGDIGGLCRRLFSSEDFRSGATRTGLVKQPVDWVVGAHRSLGLVPDALVLTSLQQLGQVPFAPPSVGGWPEGRTWLNTGAAATRLDLARQLAARADLSIVEQAAPANRPDAVAHLLGVRRWGSASAAALAHAADSPPELTTLALVAPEHLLA
jgi:uncharacterized protein (DUF1800 family)